MTDSGVPSPSAETAQNRVGVVDAAILVVFSRPWAVSLLVGLMIHLLRMLNLYVATGASYYQAVRANFFISPVSGFIGLLIPFLVPWAVTSLGRRLTRHREAEIMLQFPEMNPDLVFKLDAEGIVTYFNPSVRQFLERFELADSEVTSVLPNNYRKILDELGAKKPLIKTDSNSHGQSFEFSFRWDSGRSETFVSGRDITQRLGLERSLVHSQFNLEVMTDFLGQTFSDYNPLAFDLQQHYRSMIDQMLSDRGISQPGKPTHIFLAQERDDKLQGHVYYRLKDQKIAESDFVELSLADSRFAIRRNRGEVVWSNWEEEPENLTAYQERFHPDVRRCVGPIERYVTYQSGQVAIIAFYEGAPVGRNEGLVLKGLAVYANSLMRIALESQETEDAFEYTIEALARAAEANDEDTGDHIIRINEYSAVLARQMGLDEKFIKTIQFSAQMHDVGKIHVSPNILKKPGKLTDQEFAAMKAHPVYGAKILGDSPRFEMAVEIARSHHEKFNGKGYPMGLSGEQIPLSARIVSVADVYDALRQKRVYKPAFPHSKAVSIITEGDGRTSPEDFDPDVLAAFSVVADEMNQIFEQFQLSTVEA